MADFSTAVAKLELDALCGRAAALARLHSALTVSEFTAIDTPAGIIGIAYASACIEADRAQSGASVNSMRLCRLNKRERAENRLDDQRRKLK